MKIMSNIDELGIGKACKTMPGSLPVKRPPIDHKYVRELEDRIEFLEKQMIRKQEQYEFLYPFAARHIIQTQLGIEQPSVKELLDSLLVVAELTQPAYQQGLDLVIEIDHYEALKIMVADWNTGEDK